MVGIETKPQEQPRELRYTTTGSKLSQKVLYPELLAMDARFPESR